MEMPSVMVACFVPAEPAKALQRVQEQLKAEVPTEPGDLHMTLAYLGDHLEEDLPFLCAAVRRFASRLEPLAATITGTAQFGNEEDGIPYVALVDCSGLPTFREALVGYLQEEVGILVAKNHGYTPHVTLAYVKEPQKHIGYEAIPVEFTHLSVAWDETRRHYKMGERDKIDVAIDGLVSSAKSLWGDARECLEELEVLRVVPDLETLEVEAGKALGVSVGAVNLMLEGDYGDA